MLQLVYIQIIYLIISLLLLIINKFPYPIELIVSIFIFALLYANCCDSILHRKSHIEYVQVGVNIIIVLKIIYIIIFNKLIDKVICIVITFEILLFLFVIMKKNYKIVIYQGTRNFKYKNKKCSICLCEFIKETKIKMLSCHHIYHINCIDLWVYNNPICPTCREPY
jgi:hypothetical protein